MLWNEITKAGKWIGCGLMVVGAGLLSLWCLLRIPPNPHESRMYTYIIKIPFVEFTTDDRSVALFVFFVALGALLYFRRDRPRR